MTKEKPLYVRLELKADKHAHMRDLVGRIVTGAGLIGLVLVGAIYMHGAISSRMAVAAFQQNSAEYAALSNAIDLSAYSPDQTLWSEEARAKYAKISPRPGAPVALLKIERLNLEAPVFAGTDRITLNRGIGVVEGSPMPGEAGNVALSAHRDSFFRSLKDIAVGDVIELQTLRGILNFQVSDISIVDPLDISVLDPADESILTLITCYPFYYVGFAPDRYIVRATLVQGDVSNDEVIALQQDSTPEAIQQTL